MFINLAKNNKRGQVSIEYVLVFGFVALVVLITLGVGMEYSGSIKDNIKMTQVNNFASKIISASESVFYYGEPSKSTITSYLPESVEGVEIVDNNILIELRTSSGLNRIAFPSNVPISGNISKNDGVKNIEIVANETAITIVEEDG